MGLALGYCTLGLDRRRNFQQAQTLEFRLPPNGHRQKGKDMVGRQIRTSFYGANASLLKANLCFSVGGSAGSSFSYASWDVDASTTLTCVKVVQKSVCIITVDNGCVIKSESTGLGLGVRAMLLAKQEKMCSGTIFGEK
jgi:hypothetical protein